MEKVEKLKKNNNLKCPLFVLGVGFMRDVIEGRNINNKMFIEVLKRKQLNLPMKVVTTTSAFQRAIYLSDKFSKIQNLKFILGLVEFYPSTSNFRDGIAVDREIVKFTDIISRGDL